MPSGVDPSGISRDQAVIERYKQDPLVHDKGSLRCRMLITIYNLLFSLIEIVASILDGGEQLLTEDYKRFDPNLPILMTFGTNGMLILIQLNVCKSSY
jgi:hypothetical protein